MSFKELSERFFDYWDLDKTEKLSDLYTLENIGDMLKDVIKSEYGFFRFPDGLYDSWKKRQQKSQGRKTIKYLIEIARHNGLILYKYRFYLENVTPNDSVYSKRTINKAKAQEARILGDAPRRGRLERAGGNDGRLHIQGIVALPEGEYPSNNYKLLHYGEDIEKSARIWDAYLSKPNDCRLQRDTKTKKLKGSFSLALIAMAEWFLWKLKRSKSKKGNNPSANWTANIISARNLFL
jgi:hypothetical protein